MKRYEPSLDPTETEFQGMEEHPSGEYVKYEDALRESERLKQLICKMVLVESGILLPKTKEGMEFDIQYELQKLENEGIL